MALLTTAEINVIKADIFGIIKDSSISTSIKYRMSGTSLEYFFDPAVQELGSAGIRYAESSVSAFKGGFNSSEIESAGGAIEHGDVKFILIKSSVTGVLSNTDQIYEPPSAIQGGTTYNIIRVNRDPLNIAYFIQCRAVG